MKVVLVLFALCAGATFLQAQNKLGTVDSETTINCPAGGLTGAECRAITVTCPKVQNYTAYLKVFTHSSPVGLVMLGTGGLGNGLYEDAKYGSVAVNDLSSAGYTVVEISFGIPFVATSQVQGWQVDTNGAGMTDAACRYATIANWIKTNLTPSQPFCVSGNSAGSAVIAYGLSHYNLDGILKFALLTSGPPFSRLDWACDASQPNTLEYCTNLQRGMDVGIPNAMKFIDPSYSPNHAAACSTVEKTHSTQLDPMFLADSISAPGARTKYSITVGFLYGGKDTAGTAPNQGESYRKTITSPTTRSCVADAPHIIADALDGAQAVAQQLISNCK